MYCPDTTTNCSALIYKNGGSGNAFVQEQYKNQETEIVKEIIDMLGFEGMEDIMNINIYYFVPY